MLAPKRQTYHVRHSSNGRFVVECSWPQDGRAEMFDCLVDVAEFTSADEALAEADRLQALNREARAAYWSGVSE